MDKSKIRALPDFERRVRAIYAIYKYANYLALTYRSGSQLLGYHDNGFTTVQSRAKPNKLQTVAEHTFLTALLAALFKSAFEDVLPEPVDFESLYEALIFHEIGEVALTDLPDDGSHNRELKGTFEHTTMQLCSLPFAQASRIVDNFDTLMDDKSLAHVIDKAAFLLDLIILSKFGFSGSVERKFRKGSMSDQDRYYHDATGSDDPVDCVFAHFLKTTHASPWREFFVGIIEAGYADLGRDIPQTIRDKFY